MRLAAEATDIAAASDFLHLRWHLLMSRAEVLWMVGESDERAFTLAEAAALPTRRATWSPPSRRPGCSPLRRPCSSKDPPDGAPHRPERVVRDGVGYGNAVSRL